MITRNNFKDLLRTLDFIEEGDIFQKSIAETTLRVDFDKKEIIYPEGVEVHEHQTCNFSQNENFVVFECVHRLLAKGYKPEHLELERPYRIGHSASGGRTDILVKDQEKNPLLIIECKTAGVEFEKAWDETRQNGGQLFSYVHQEADTKYLCLYASSFINNELDFTYKLIPHLDNPQILAEDTNLMSFDKANKAEQRFAVWRETYKLEFTENGIFEDNIQAYHIGKSKYTLAEDTKPIGAVDKDSKYHDFRTILRKHNIARRENAFEVLVNLFLCKLVDEEENRNDLKFYWNGPASDDYFDFVDRLQNLYHRGMRKFLNEEISYVSREQIDDAFWPVKNDRNATKKKIHDYFRELKFFSNSAFSFLDTHNKDLFDRNTAVLSEVVQMWQGLRLKTDEQNQFLGDMFEFFLDNGIKQSEGQFFTPLPICKFIVSSLPLAQKIEGNSEPLKVIDYACGSGHFLNEYAYQIKKVVPEQKRDLYYSQIIGIEKEDRLAKVAKVAAYMHGQEQIKILDADALAAHPEIPPKSFDVLIANPPFAVEGFLQTLSDTDKERYQLIQATGENSNTNNIECFFLERIHHLMAPGGIVGVIVPSSILSNTEAVHNRTREILLQFFDIVSIAELGSGTFGKTGTNTVVLFLRRKTKTPEPAEHYRNRVSDFFEGDDQVQYQDKTLIEAYCNHIDVSFEEYKKLFLPTNLERLSKLFQYDIFHDYKETFRQSTEIKNLRKSTKFKKKTSEEQSRVLEQRLIASLHKIEKEKLFYFILAHEQENSVLIVNAPNTNRERKQFLGYEWSGRKGREGIKYEGGETVNDIITPLFDPKDPDNISKINTAIKRNFIGPTTDPLPEHCRYAKLTDMLNFNRVDFDKIIRLTPTQNIEIETQHPLVKLGEICNLYQPHTITSNEIKDEGNYKVYGANGIIGYYHEYNHEFPEVVVTCRGATCGTVNFTESKVWITGNAMVAQPKDEKKLLKKYLYEILKFCNLNSTVTGTAQPQITRENLSPYKIPLPPQKKQQQIVGECHKVDQQTDQARVAITTVKQEIEEKVHGVINAGHEMKNINRVLTLEYGDSLPERERSNGDFPVYGSNGVVGNHNSFSVKAPCIIVGRKGSAGEVNWSDKDCTPIDTAFYVKLLDETVTDLKYVFHMLKSLNLPSLRGGSGPGGINRNNIYGLQIPFPPLHIQQKLVAEVEQLEAKITEAQAVIDNATERKNAILTKYL